jgi:hypothetical protein
VPFESISRFVLDRPMYLTGESAVAHIEQGWGLTCLEKARLLAWQLDRRRVPNTIVGGALEAWADGVNLLGAKGSATAAPDEARLSRVFALDRTASPYEAPPQMSHWANSFELDGTTHLVDCVGDAAVFRHFSGADAHRLLDDSPKAYVDYLTNARIYYHRFSPAFLDLFARRDDLDPDYILGRILGNAMYMHDRLIITPRWWWREPQLRDALEHAPSLTTRATAGEATLRFIEHPAELRDVEGVQLPERLQQAFEAAWPNVLAQIARIFANPPFVRLSVQQTRLPMREYTTHTVRYAGSP